jgi:DNA polymerase III alpha subunit (gram-positive type)
VTTCSSPVTSLNDYKTNSTVTTTVQSTINHDEHNRQSLDHHNHHHNLNNHQQQHQQQQQQQQQQNQQQQQQQTQQHHQIPSHHSFLSIQQSRPIIQQHQIIETIKTEEIDIKPTIHDLMAGNIDQMEVDGQGNNNIIVTPEIANMMSTPSQIGMIFS